MEAGFEKEGTLYLGIYVAEIRVKGFGVETYTRQEYSATWHHYLRTIISLFQLKTLLNYKIKFNLILS